MMIFPLSRFFFQKKTWSSLSFPLAKQSGVGVYFIFGHAQLDYHILPVMKQHLAVGSKRSKPWNHGEAQNSWWMDVHPLNIGPVRFNLYNSMKWTFWLPWIFHPLPPRGSKGIPYGQPRKAKCNAKEQVHAPLLQAGHGARHCKGWVLATPSGTASLVKTPNGRGSECETQESWTILFWTIYYIPIHTSRI